MKSVVTYYQLNGMTAARKRGTISHFLIFITHCSLLIALLLSVASCKTIDDDLSDCGNDYQLDYELRLVTNMTTELKTELQTELSTQAELQMAAALRAHLQNIFTDFAHDVDLSFYDTEGDSIRLQHDQHVMDANQASYTLYLPMRRYMHLATANIVENPVVALAADERCHTSYLRQNLGTGAAGGGVADTIVSHTTGVFTARQPMEVFEGIDQTFDVKLYIANCAATLVVDTLGSGARDVKVYTTGFATGFSIADSSYIYTPDATPIVRTERVTTADMGSLLSFCSVSFPSPEKPLTRIIIDNEDPFITSEAEGSLWEIRIYVTTADAATTETVFYVHKPLRAGQLKITKAKINPDGSAGTVDAAVGVSVQLNWNPGGHYNPEF